VSVPPGNSGVDEQTKSASVVIHNPPWKAKSVWIAAVLALLGSFLWIGDHSKQPPPAASSFSDFGRSGGAAAAEKKNPKPSSPALFRVGVSYVGGFFLGWSLRRFLKATLLLGGAAFALFAVGKRLGWVEIDWASVEGHVRASLAWMQGEAASLRSFLTGYLPSTGAAGLGCFFGFRRK
jgi:uncharacterized membrane protein (Fun14 family)